jgi:hypothetical protein
MGFSSINVTLTTSTTVVGLSPSVGYEQGADFTLTFDGTPYNAIIQLDGEDLEILE